MRRVLRIGSAVLAAVVSLAAGEAPPLIPTRDVDVTYDLPGAAGAVLHERLRWDTAGHRLRVDPPGSGVYMITDYMAHRMSIVRDASRSIVEAVAPAAGLPGTSLAPYQQDGSDRVAGVSCTEWATIDTEQHPVAVCVTPDGVLLRVRRDGRTLLSARQVTFGPQDPALFRLPADYRR
jgi:hypothetical protein